MDIIPYYFENDGVIPNNPLPLLIYKNALQYASNKNFGLSFKKNGWTNNWEDIILPYDHFHSNTHEVLGLTKGNARLMIGGRNGEIVLVETGDVIILPAGCGHYSVDNSLDYQFVGGYPNGAYAPAWYIPPQQAGAISLRDYDGIRVTGNPVLIPTLQMTVNDNITISGDNLTLDQVINMIASSFSLVTICRSGRSIH
jgi:uncharacterized protein YjlB